MKRKEFKEAFLATLPVLTGYLVLGMGFGIIMNSNGYGIIPSVAMAIFIYAGSMQYMAISLFTGGASLVTVAVTTLMVNARHLFYGISMIDKYRGMGAVKPYLIFALTDETYSLVCVDMNKTKEERKRFYSLVTVMDQCYWVTGCALGSIIGTLIPFDSTGIDFALTALFITVFTDQWLKSKNHVSAISGVVISVICLIIFGKSNFLIPAMIGITIALALLKKFTGEAETDADAG